MEHILEIDNLCKRYDDFTLQNISLALPRGAIIGLIGENGAGKTTTLQLILNEIAKDSGSIRIFGKDHLEAEIEIKQRLGVVFDECCLPDLFDANALERVLRRVYADWQHQTYQQYLDAFALPAGKRIRDFSRGMKVKLAFAVALSHNASLLLLDEATSGLDPVVRDDILDLLLDFVQDENNSVLFSSHITSDLEKIADHIAFLHQGRLLFCRSKDELIYRYAIVRCGAADFARLDPADIIAWRQHAHGMEALVADRALAERKYRGCVVDPASIDEIMLFYIKGERACMA